MDASSFARQRYFDPRATAADHRHERRLLQLLLAQDGSTTRICETIAAGPLRLQVLRQCVVEAAPDAVRALLPGRQFLERLSWLGAHGEIMMDNLVYVALEGLPAGLRSGLESGSIPIGHLLETLWVRRRALRVDQAAPLQERLWGEVGLADAPASRAYTIATPDGPLFLIAETFRRGMQMMPGAGSGAGASGVA
jgi:chorismate-pyruvate lyase